MNINLTDNVVDPTDGAPRHRRGQIMTGVDLTPDTHADIELAAEAMHVSAASRPRFGGLVVALVAALCLTIGLLAGTLTLPRHAAATTVPAVRVEVGVSVYPAPAGAAWRGADGVAHEIDVWSGKPVTVPAVEVTLSVAQTGDAPVQCALYINRRIVDLAVTRAGAPVVTCSWVATDTA